MNLKSVIKSTIKFFKSNYYWTTSDSQKEKILKKWYYKTCGRTIDLENPRTFNEKIQWLKLYDSTELKTILADKYLAREYVADKIGKEHLIPMLGVWDKFEDIDFNKLPDKFVLKANHGSGWNSIIKDKNSMDFSAEKKKFDKWMKLNFTTEYGYELHYMNIPPKIVAEEYMADLDGTIYDYRFFCFNGEPKYVWVDCGSGTQEHTRTIFDASWNKQDYLINYPAIEPTPEKPDTFEEMKEYAKVLSKEFAFVRVDFYSLNGKVYFGELTFTPQSGSGKFDDEQNSLYGDLIRLPQKSPIPKKKRK